ncbi:MAG: SAM-dependent methyltransferase, partial [Propionibacteriaceae bacterium]|nr:SAM-dependent methyltransferase [Propionibacteriaceae bacterium]
CQLDDLTHLTQQPDQALYLDPARRSAAGPSWSVDQLSPAWSTVTAALTSAVGPVVVKLGPGLPHHLIPAPTQATWVSHDGDLVELSLWRGPTWAASWQAVSLPSGRSLPGGQPAPATGPLGRFLWEPDPAVIRARALAPLAEQLAAHGLVDQIAYLTGDADRLTPWAQRFEVLEVLPFDDKKVRAWIRQRGIGHLEIKTRGLGLDPARWRRRLGLKGPERATVIVTPSPTGAVVLVVCRQPTRC